MLSDDEDDVERNAAGEVRQVKSTAGRQRVANRTASEPSRPEDDGGDVLDLGALAALDQAMTDSALENQRRRLGPAAQDGVAMPPHPPSDGGGDAPAAIEPARFSSTPPPLPIDPGAKPARRGSRPPPALDEKRPSSAAPEEKDDDASSAREESSTRGVSRATTPDEPTAVAVATPRLKPLRLGAVVEVWWRFPSGRGKWVDGEVLEEFPENDTYKIRYCGDEAGESDAARDGVVSRKRIRRKGSQRRMKQGGGKRELAHGAEEKIADPAPLPPPPTGQAGVAVMAEAAAVGVQTQERGGTRRKWSNPLALLYRRPKLATVPLPKRNAPILLAAHARPQFKPDS